MNRAFFAIALAMAFFPTPAFSQPPGPPPSGSFGPVARPTFSPYLNLTRQANFSPAVNYFGVVRPFQQQQNAIQNLQQSSPFMRPDAMNASQDQVVVTGNPFGFQNHLSYFQNQFNGGGFGLGNSSRNGQQMPNNSRSQLGSPPPSRRR